MMGNDWEEKEQIPLYLPFLKGEKMRKYSHPASFSLWERGIQGV